MCVTPRGEVLCTCICDTVLCFGAVFSVIWTHRVLLSFLDWKRCYYLPFVAIEHLAGFTKHVVRNRKWLHLFLKQSDCDCVCDRKHWCFEDKCTVTADVTFINCYFSLSEWYRCDGLLFVRKEDKSQDVQIQLIGDLSWKAKLSFYTRFWDFTSLLLLVSTVTLFLCWTLRRMNVFGGLKSRNGFSETNPNLCAKSIYGLST